MTCYSLVGAEFYNCDYNSGCANGTGGEMGVVKELAMPALAPTEVGHVRISDMTRRCCRNEANEGVRRISRQEGRGKRMR